MQRGKYTDRTDEPRGAIFLRPAESLNKRIVEAAHKAKTSISRWVLQAAEQRLEREE